MKPRCKVDGCGLAASDVYDGYCWQHRDFSLKRRYKNLVARSSKRVDFDISFEEYQDIVKDSTCDYCNKALPKTGHGLDRVDSKYGYTKENVVPCCSECNTLKGNRFTYHQMKILIEFIKEMEDNGWRRPLNKTGGKNGI